MDYAKYYENLYKPKNTGSTSKTVTPAPTNVSTTSSSGIPDSVQQRIDHEQMNALLRAVKSSKSAYESDIATYSAASKQLDLNSPIIKNFSDNIAIMLKDSTISNEYDNSINRVSNVLY